MLIYGTSRATSGRHHHLERSAFSLSRGFPLLLLPAVVAVNLLYGEGFLYAEALRSKWYQRPPARSSACQQYPHASRPTGVDWEVVSSNNSVRANKANNNSMLQDFITKPPLTTSHQNHRKTAKTRGGGK